jgi:ATP-dependent DNA helicase
MYHGTPAERAELRRTVMLPPGSKPKTTVSPKASKKITKITKPTEVPTKRSQNLRNKGKLGTRAVTPEITEGNASLRRSRRFRRTTIVIDSDDDDDDANEETYQPQEDDDELQIMDVDTPPPDEEDTESTSLC